MDAIHFINLKNHNQVAKSKVTKVFRLQQYRKKLSYAWVFGDRFLRVSLKSLLVGHSSIA